MALYDDPRSAWTTRTPSGRVRIAPSSRTGVAWHWAGPRVGLFGKAHSSCLSQVRSWESYHMSKGWNSIGYNGLICVHARVIEGRGFDYRGAHAGPKGNDPTYGVQFMLGQGEAPSTAMYDRAYRLERDLWEHSGRRLDSFGHRDFMSTDCPGDQIYKWAHSPHDLTTPVPVPEEDIMTPEQEKRVLDAIAAVPGRVWSIRLENPLSPDTTDPKASEWLINTRLQAGYSAGDARKAKDAIVALAAGFGPEVEARVKDALKDAVVDVNVNFPVSEPTQG